MMAAAKRAAPGEPRINLKSCLPAKESAQTKGSTTMSQDNKSSNTGEQKQQAEPAEASQAEESVGTKSAEARIWAAANKLTRDGKRPLRENQEEI
jgi:hypothetical protein